MNKYLSYTFFMLIIIYQLMTFYHNLFTKWQSQPNLKEHSRQVSCLETELKSLSLDLFSWCLMSKKINYKSNLSMIILSSMPEKWRTSSRTWQTIKSGWNGTAWEESTLLKKANSRSLFFTLWPMQNWDKVEILMKLLILKQGRRSKGSTSTLLKVQLHVNIE